MTRKPALLLTLLAAGLAAPAHAALPQQSGHVDLLTQGDGAFRGQAGTSRFYDHLGVVGDVTGDGIEDVAVARGYQETYELLVLPGGALPSGAVGEALPAGTLRVRFAAADGTVTEAAAAGDVNGDGTGDLVVGMPVASNAGQFSGSAWVVFGRPGGGTVDLTQPGHGFRIDGRANDGGDRLGEQVDGAGDVDGDGLADVIVSAASYGPTNGGGAVVVRGSASSAVVATTTLATRGFRIVATGDDSVGDDVAGAGDVDGDGLDDVIVGGSGFDGPEGSESGAAWVVRGRKVDVPTSLTLPTAAASWGDGFRIDGPDDTAYTGVAISAVGDLNGDGRPEVAVAGTGDDRFTTNGGHASVVYGRGPGAPVALANLGSQGFEVINSGQEEAFGRTLVADRDIDGDGRPDLIAGAPEADPLGRTYAGKVYVLDAPGPGAVVDIDDPPAGTIVMSGSRGASGDVLASGVGFAVAAGDVDGDARADVLVMERARTLFEDGKTSSPIVRVVRGFGAPAVGGLADATGVVGAPLAVAGPQVLGRTGTPSFSVSPVLPTGLTLDPATGAISGTPAAALAQTTFAVTMTDLAGSVSTPLRLTISGPPAGGGGGSADTTAPALTNARMVKARVARKRRPEVGFTLSEAATVTVTFERRGAGRRSAKRCVKPSAKLRRAKRCVRWVKAATVKRALQPGARRVAAAKALPRGSYRALLVARDAAGNASAAKVLRFTVTAR